MTEETTTKPKTARGRKKKSVTVLSCNENGYGSFAMLRNDGVLPLTATKGVAVVECKKSKSVATSQVLFKSFQQVSDAKQCVYVSHVLGQSIVKNTIKATLKQLKKVPFIIMYISSDAKGESEELEQLALAIKKHSSLIICYHKTGNLISPTLISCSRAVFACFNKDKEDGKALCNMLLGRNSPYARIDIDGAQPFAYSVMGENSKDYTFTGYGLSYVNFSYTNVSLTRYTAKIGETFDVEVTVTNNSQYTTSEITQLYVTPDKEYLPKLIDYGEYKISAGESVTLSFSVDTSKLNYPASENSESRFFVCVGKSSLDVVKIPFRVIF